MYLRIRRSLEADCIIVAADAKVPMDRFDGKKVIECQVSDGISKADQLVEQCDFRRCSGISCSSRQSELFLQMQKQAAEQATRSICS